MEGQPQGPFLTEGNSEGFREQAKITKHFKVEQDLIFVSFACRAGASAWTGKRKFEFWLHWAQATPSLGYLVLRNPRVPREPSFPSLPSVKESQPSA